MFLRSTIPIEVGNVLSHRGFVHAIVCRDVPLVHRLSFNDVLGVVVSETGARAHDGAAKPAALDLANVIQNEDGRKGIAIDGGIEGAELFAKQPRQHGDHLLDHVDGCGTRARLQIECRTFLDKVADIGNVHADLPFAISGPVVDLFTILLFRIASFTAQCAVRRRDHERWAGRY